MMVMMILMTMDFDLAQQLGSYCNILQSCLSEDKDWGFDLAGEGS